MHSRSSQFKTPQFKGATPIDCKNLIRLRILQTHQQTRDPAHDGSDVHSQIPVPRSRSPAPGSRSPAPESENPRKAVQKGADARRTSAPRLRRMSIRRREGRRCATKQMRRFKMPSRRRCRIWTAIPTQRSCHDWRCPLSKLNPVKTDPPESPTGTAMSACK